MKIESINQLNQLKLRIEMQKGCGGQVFFDYPIDPEPPFAPFNYGNLDSTDILFLDKKLELAFHLQKLYGNVLPFHPPQFNPPDKLKILHVLPSIEDPSDPSIAEQWLLSLNGLSYPVSFEIIGTKEKINFQIYTYEQDCSHIKDQLLSSYPTCDIFEADDLLVSHLNANPIIYTYNLFDTYFLPLRTFTHFKQDPLSALLGSLSYLEKDQFASLQILFKPCLHNWASNIRIASKDQYEPTKSVFVDDPHFPKLAEEKASKPFFATVITIIASNPEIASKIESYLNQFQSPHNKFIKLEAQNSYSKLLESVSQRITYRFGALLNSTELSGLVHLPNLQQVYFPKLEAVRVKTASAPSYATQDGEIILGENVFHGERKIVYLPKNLRTRHTVIIGKTGTGKTTLLINEIIQDIESNRGVAIISPHLDLVSKILPRIPKHRVKDTLYLNIADKDFPFAFNPLHIFSGENRELTCSDLLVVLERFFTSSAWGNRIEHILRYFISSLLYTPQTTLRDIIRLIDEPSFRRKIISNIKDPDLLAFWEFEFENYTSQDFARIKSKIGKLLGYPTARNILCQPYSKIDFLQVMNEGKIVLINLSPVEIGEDIASLFGNLFISKFQLASMKRPITSAKDFHLYIDELPALLSGASPTLSSIYMRLLSESRKFSVSLTLVCQFWAQLPYLLQKAILGNVGTIVCFGLGVDDAQRLEKDMGIFTASDLLNLMRGEAIVRMESAKDSFNIRTFLPPPEPKQNYIQEIIESTRQNYCTPKEEVEKRFIKERMPYQVPDKEEDFYV